MMAYRYQEQAQGHCRATLLLQRTFMTYGFKDRCSVKHSLLVICHAQPNLSCTAGLMLYLRIAVLIL
jgi:hypothetical protein